MSDRYFVQTVAQEDLFFWWVDDEQQMYVFLPGHHTDWNADPANATPETLNQGIEIMGEFPGVDPDSPFYIHEIDDSILNYRLRQEGY